MKAFTLALGLLLAAGCGGRVSLLTDKQPTPVPQKLEVPRTTEVFQYGKGNGILVLPIVFFSSKTMTEWADRFVSKSASWAETVCKLPFQQIEMSLASESAVAALVTEGFSPGTDCSANVQAWLNRNRAPLITELQKDTGVSPPPFESLGSVLQEMVFGRNTAVRSLSEKIPRWVQIVYFRDQGLLGSMTERPGLSSIEALTNRAPLSSRRLGVSSFTYLSASSACVPPASRLSDPSLRHYLKGLPGTESELCDFGAGDFAKIANYLVAVSARMKLAVSKAKNIQVTLAGRLLEREKFHYDPEPSEVRIRDSALPQIGDTVEVSYETE